MILPAIEELLKRAIGLDAGTIGPNAIVRAVQERQAACGAGDTAAYYERLLASEAEMRELIEAVVVPETWFFRDREAFAAVARLAAEWWLRKRAGTGLLRLLCVPCSTGEEPYSVAMTLLDAGLPADRFLVEGIDVSESALARARRAVYGRNSFRGADLGFRDRHFDAGKNGFRLAEAVRKPVTFRRGNLLEGALAPDGEGCDMIFCRNLLIYFDHPTQVAAVKILGRALAEGGTLFVGPSETGLLLSRGFVSARIPLAFAFRKGSGDRAHGAAKTQAPPKRRPAPVSAASSLPSSKPVAAVPAPAAIAAGALQPEFARPSGNPDELAEIERLANQGDLAGAAGRCAELLRRPDPPAQAFYLMGLVRDASGDADEAVRCYRKALYLDPDHRDSLIHLSLIAQRQGDAKASRALTARALRLEARSTG